MLLTNILRCDIHRETALTVLRTISAGMTGRRVKQHRYELEKTCVLELRHPARLSLSCAPESDLREYDDGLSGETTTRALSRCATLLSDGAYYADLLRGYHRTKSIVTRMAAFQKLPLLTKELIRANFERLHPGTTTAAIARKHVRRLDGRTGAIDSDDEYRDASTALQWLITINLVALWARLMLRLWARKGIWNPARNRPSLDFQLVTNTTWMTHSRCRPKECEDYRRF